MGRSVQKPKGNRSSEQRILGLIWNIQQNVNDRDTNQLEIGFKENMNDRNLLISLLLNLNN